MSVRQRIDQQPGFVLHSYPYRETSLIVEVFSRDHGRIGLVAKGARRPMSQLRGVLMAFQPLLIDWSGGGEMKTLVRAEWQGGHARGNQQRGRPIGRPPSAGALAATGKLVADQAQRGTGSGEVR